MNVRTTGRAAASDCAWCYWFHWFLHPLIPGSQLILCFTEHRSRNVDPEEQLDPQVSRSGFLHNQSAVSSSASISDQSKDERRLDTHSASRPTG